MKKRLFCLVLSILMLFSLLPGIAAAETEPEDADVPSDPVVDTNGDQDESGEPAATMIAELPADGDRVVIRNAQYNKALDACGTNESFNAGVDIDTLNDASEDLIWDVTVNEDGTFRFSQNGRFLSMVPEDFHTSYDEENRDWEIAAHGDGYSIKNVAREVYLRWNADGEYFDAVAEIDDTGAFDFLFCQTENTASSEDPAEEPAEEPEEPVEEPVEPAEDQEEPEKPEEKPKEESVDCEPVFHGSPDSKYGSIYVEPSGSRAVSDAYLRGDMEAYYRLTGQVATRDTLPSKYDSRTYNCVTSVKDQGSYGSCWAHAAMASVESYMIKHGVPVGIGSAETTSLNLSESHLCYFTYTNAYDAEGMLTGDKTTRIGTNCMNGGSQYLASYTLHRWTGAADETNSALKYSNASSVVSNGLSSQYAYGYDDCHVQNSIWIPATNIDAIKRAIMEHGAGTISYFAGNDDIGTYTNIYQCTIDTTSQDSDDHKWANHDITVIGWDDSIAVSRFSPDKPSSPGAWLCKNSWGTDVFMSGYMYISYEDTSVLEDIFCFYDAEPISNYDHNYQYDGTGCGASRVFTSSSVQIANIFTAKGREHLQAVSFAINDEAVSYTIEVYTNPSTGNPSSGTLKTTQTGSLVFPGYYTIPLNTPVALSAGEVFSVVITISVPVPDADGYYCHIPYDRTGSFSWYSSTHTDHGNTSYYKTPNGSWTDCANNGDLRIKAFTDDSTVTTVTVTFDANGGTASSNSKQVTVGETYGTLPTATRSGYNFTGWYTSKSGGSKVTSSTTVTNSSNHTLYAHWSEVTPTTVTVTFDANGGTASSNSKQVTVGETYGTLPTATRSGYNFIGWYTAKSGGSQVTASTTVTNTSNHTLYAHWAEAVTVTVTFDANGGDVSPGSKQVTVGETYGLLPTPTRDNYIFNGWFTSASGGTKVTSSTTVTNSSNHTLYAHWTGKPINVYFNARGGEVSESKKTVRYYETYGELPTPTRENYTFDGWYTGMTDGTKITASTIVTNTANHTLYAHWTGKPINVYFNARGGEVSQSSKQVNYGSTYGTLPTPTRENYVFEGWYTGMTDGTKITASTVVTNTANHTLYAHWTGKSINVYFNARGGEVSESKKTVRYYETYGELPTPTRENFTFDGWYTGMTDGTKITASTRVTNTANHTLYAHWTGKVVNVYFNAQGGEVSESKKTVNYYGTYGELPTPTRENFTFDGWYTGMTDGTKITASTRVTNTANHTLYAHWTGKAVNVYFNARGGEVSVSKKTVNYYSTYGELPTPTRENYVFEGWYTGMTDGTKITASTVVTNTANHTIYAHWTGKPINVYFNARGGEVSESKKTVRYYETYGELPTPTRENYTFDGWYTGMTDGTKITASTRVTNTANHTLYAHWTGKAVNVFFNAQGGEVSESKKTVRYYETYGELPTPTRENFTFDGWYTEMTGGTKITASTKVTNTANHTLYAHWTGKAVNVYFNARGGEVSVSKKTVNYYGTYGELPTPTRENFTFDGWYTEINGGTQITSTTVVTNLANHTIYAHWTGKAVNVYFNARGGEVSVNKKTVNYYGTYGELPIPTRENFTFNGWYTEINGGTKITSTTVVTNLANHTIYAHWTGKAVNVYFNARGGEVSESKKTVHYYETYGELPTPTRENYVFEGWYTGMLDGTKITASTVVTNTANHTIYAHWTGKAVNVYFNARGGEVSESKKTVRYYETYGELPTPTRENYTFDGWYTGMTDGTKITASTRVTNTANHTLYAHWTGISLTVTFDANGGSVSPSSISVVYGSTYGELPTPTRENYTFDGWYTEMTGGTKITSSTKVNNTANHTLYAHWTGKPINVYFNARGGEVSVSKITVNYGSVYGELPTPTRENYTFDGWYTGMTDGTKITSATEVTNPANHTIYAHWTGKQVKVFFNAKGGSVSPSSKAVNYDSPYGELPTPTRDNYTFIGWYTEASGGTKITSTTKVTQLANHTIYAHWTGKTVNVYFNARGGEVSENKKTVNYNSTYGELPTPTRENYTFDGWYTEMIGGTKITSTTKVTKTVNHTIYAHWTGVKMNVYFNPRYGTVTPTSKAVYYGDIYGDLPIPTRDGYIFTGWYTAASGGTKITSATKVTKTANHTIYAVWTTGDSTAPAFDGTIEWNTEDLEWKGTTPYVIANGKAHTPRFTVKDANGNAVAAANYTYYYAENINAGTGYVIVTFKSRYSGTAQAWFKIYLPATENTEAKNTADGITLTWTPVEGAAGYVIYRRAKNNTTGEWTDFARWNNTTALTWTDTSVYGCTVYQYGIKAYFEQRVDPISGATIGGNVGDNYNLGMVGPIATMARIGMQTMTALTAGTKSFTASWTKTTAYTGYEIQYATGTEFGSTAVTITIADQNTTSKTVSSLQSNTKYYVRIRCYYVVDSVTYYGDWSSPMNCTVK